MDLKTGQSYHTSHIDRDEGSIQSEQEETSFWDRDMESMIRIKRDTPTYLSKMRGEIARPHLSIEADRVLCSAGHLHDPLHPVMLLVL